MRSISQIPVLLFLSRFKHAEPCGRNLTAVEYGVMNCAWALIVVL
jgi:hypothetical protein